MRSWTLTECRIKDSMTTETKRLIWVAVGSLHINTHIGNITQTCCSLSYQSESQQSSQIDKLGEHNGG